MEYNQIERVPPVQLGIVALLTAIAGWVDVIGYLVFSHLFVSFMGGNSTKMMLAVAAGQRDQIWLIASVITAFVAGVMAGEFFVVLGKRWQYVMVYTVEALLLWSAVYIMIYQYNGRLLVLLLALSMGIQNATMRPRRVLPAHTYVTGTLVHIGHALASLLMRTADWRKIVPFGAVWLGFTLGSVGSALVYLYVGKVVAMLVPAIFISVIAVISFYKSDKRIG